MTIRIREHILAGLLIPSLIAGQGNSGSSEHSASDSKISESVIKLLRKPRLGKAQLTWRDGRTKEGSILRVTDQFIAFETSQRPRACENVALSDIAGVHSVHTPGEPKVGAYVAEVLILGIFLGPFYVADAIAYPFKRISPPMKPLSGSWEGGGTGENPKSSLEFTGGNVRYLTTIHKRGHWLVEHNKLHLTLDGEPERIGSFHFECEELVLNDPHQVFRQWQSPGHAAAPITGDWHGRNLSLNFQPDGSLTEQRSEVRTGTFENTLTNLKTHWTDSTGPGGQEWIAQIKDRSIVVTVSGVTTKYHFVPPSIFEWDE